MRRFISVILCISIFIMVLSGCGSNNKSSTDKDEITQYTEDYNIPGTDLTLQDYSNKEVLRFLEDTAYTNLVTELNSDEYFVENVQAVYISQEYIEELEYNSQSSIYFGYTLDEVRESFQESKFVFTLGEDGKTTVKAFENYDDTYDKVIKNVAIGTGVILVCVVVSVATGGAAPAASLIFAASAKGGAMAALSGGLVSGVSAGLVTGLKTGDTSAALKAAALQGSEAFKWGAITGALAGGASKAIALKGATANGLTMNEAATIQKESKYPLDVIKEFKSMDQYKVCKDAGLTAKTVNGHTALIRDNIDLKFKDEFGRTNLERMKEGLSALDPATGKAYELHHVGQKADSTLAILTQEEHRLGDNYSLWHELGSESNINRIEFNKIREDFWKSMANILLGG